MIRLENDQYKQSSKERENIKKPNRTKHREVQRVSAILRDNLK